MSIELYFNKDLGDDMKINASNYSAEEILKIIREWTELTQEQFAEKTKVSKGTIQNYEQGKRNYTFKWLLDVCKKNNIKIIFEKNKKL